MSTPPPLVSPVRRHFLRGALAVGATLSAPCVARPARRSSSHVVPPAYRNAALSAKVPARLLFAVALQESAMLFGERLLPWLWTLNIRGVPHRYATYRDAVAALSNAVTRRGIRNVDCGPMQINWRWHSDKLRTFELALEANYNLAVGAQILAGHFVDTNDWHAATGLYHNQVDKTRSRRYADAVFARLPRIAEAAT